MIVNMSHIIVEYSYYLALPYSENGGLGFELVGFYSGSISHHDLMETVGLLLTRFCSIEQTAC